MGVDIQVLKRAIERLKKDGILKNQKEIALKTDYSPITISEILNEKQPLSEKFVKTFARVYDLNPDSLDSFEAKIIKPKNVSDKNIDQLIQMNYKLVDQVSGFIEMQKDMIIMQKELVHIQVINSNTINNLTNKEKQTDETALKNVSGGL
ncbi:helix-turn-helix transcriptional regulator [bacterium]|jgi:transcriptional regulator with XRE-family HTH domain|nr:helix-turn-helix transcriptional regulator [bacterium]